MATNKRTRAAVASGASYRGYYTYHNNPSGLTVAHWLFSALKFPISPDTLYCSPLPV
jgi:hypothetical protein